MYISNLPAQVPASRPTQQRCFTPASLFPGNGGEQRTFVSQNPSRRIWDAGLEHISKRGHFGRPARLNGYSRAPGAILIHTNPYYH
jgi:hypothetical protein